MGLRIWQKDRGVLTQDSLRRRCVTLADLQAHRQCDLAQGLFHWISSALADNAWTQLCASILVSSQPQRHVSFWFTSNLSYSPNKATQSMFWRSSRTGCLRGQRGFSLSLRPHGTWKCPRSWKKETERDWNFLGEDWSFCESAESLWRAGWSTCMMFHVSSSIEWTGLTAQ